MRIITLSDLTKAIANRLCITYSEAKMYALKVLDFFGYEDRVIDNLLEREDRQLFYELQKHGILFAEREEMTLPDGRGWRIHYWHLDKKTIFTSTDNVLNKCLETTSKVPDTTEMEDIYNSLSSDIWTSRKVPH